ncbi:MAG: serine/threonine protein phosphatase PrpC/CRP-like cAMP-binding protein [Myxococcota bacterium]|jgi:serine/threonine protein phosphatase PrpC/CRP-like cAMP-binding protein
MIQYAAQTDVGRRRNQNEDALFASAERGVFVVADGVGGRAAGELASALTVETFEAASDELRAAVFKYTNRPEWETRNEVLELLDGICQRASRSVYDESERRNKRGMTTTLVVALVGGGAVFLAHVGDSRAYLIRDGLIRQLTEDHSMVNELVRAGQMTYEEAIRSRYRSVITRAVGLYPTVQADVMCIEVLPGDRLVLCSDGLSDPVSEEDIESIASQDDVETATSQLILRALENGGPDNVTVVLIEPEASEEAESARARAQVMEELFLFTDLPFHARLRVSRICEELFFTPGQVLVTEEAPGDAMFVIVQGHVVVSRNDIPLARLEAGQHFGELGLLDDTPRSATVSGGSYGSAVVVRRTQLLEFTQRDPELGNHILLRLLAALGERLRHMNARLTNNAILDIPASDLEMVELTADEPTTEI